MNQSPVASSIWTWTWLEGPFTGIVQPLVGNKIDIRSGPDPDSPMVTLWNTPAGFVVQISGKKVSLNGICSDVYLLQPGDQLRTKKFAAQVDLVIVPCDEEAGCSDWETPEPHDHCDLTPYLEDADPGCDEGSESSSESFPEKDSVKTHQDSELLLASEPNVSGNESLGRPTVDSTSSNDFAPPPRENNQIILAVQALEGIKRQLEQGADNVSPAILNSIDDICRRLDQTGELVEELTSGSPQGTDSQRIESPVATAAESIVESIEESAAETNQRNTFQNILKRLAEESVDVTDLMKDRVEKSISDVELLGFDSLDLACSLSEKDFPSTNPICVAATVSELPTAPTIEDLAPQAPVCPSPEEYFEPNQSQPVEFEENEIATIDEMEGAYGLDNFGQSSLEFDSVVHSSPTTNHDAPAYSEPFVNELLFENAVADCGVDAPSHRESNSKTESHEEGADDVIFAGGLGPELVQDNHTPDLSDPPVNFGGCEHFDTSHQSLSELAAEPLMSPSDEVPDCALDTPQLDWSGLSSVTHAESAEDEFDKTPMELTFDDVEETIGGTQTLASAAFLNQRAAGDVEQPVEAFSPPENNLASQHSDPPTRTVDHESDVGISDYMNQLFSRLRGDEPVASAPGSNVSVSFETKHEPIESTKIEELQTPLTAEEYIPQKTAPERKKDLNAMRRLANESTRAALSTFNVQQQKAMANARIGGIVGLIGFAAAMFLLSEKTGDMISLLGMMSLLGAAGIGGWHYLVLQKLKNLQPAIEIQPPLETSPDHD